MNGSSHSSSRHSMPGSHKTMKGKKTGARGNVGSRNFYTGEDDAAPGWGHYVTIGDDWATQDMVWVSNDDSDEDDGWGDYYW